MNNQLIRWLVILFVLGLSGCNWPTPASGISIWIDVPPDGLSVDVGDTVRIEGHAASVSTLSRVDIIINGELVVSIDDPLAKGALSHYEHLWIPDAEGAYNIQVVAYSANGESSEPDSAVVVVYAAGEKVTPVRTALSLTPGTPTVTPTGERTRTITPSPTITTTWLPTWTNTATWLPTWTHTPTIPPPDTTPPSAPSGLAPGGGATLPCMANVNLQWGSVSDPSGISEYRVEVQRSSDGSNWGAHPAGPWSGISGTSLTINVECAWYYRWRILAVDGAGNVGAYSGWTQFAVTLG